MAASADHRGRFAPHFRSNSLPKIAVTTAIGTIIGCSVGVYYARERSQFSLGEDVHRARIAVEQVLESSQTALSIINQSPNSECSEADLEDLRRILYERSFLKDVGHMGNGRIDCSASFAKRSLRGTDVSRPLISGVNDELIYKNVPFFSLQGESSFLIARGGAYVVLDTDSLMPVSGETVQVSMFDVTSGKRISLDGGPLLDQATGGSERWFSQFVGNIHAGECSERFQTCATVRLPMARVIERFSVVIDLGAVVGALLGSLSLSMISAARRKNRTLAKQLRRAIQQKKIRVVYQPIVDLKSRKIVEAEALARWTDEEGAAVSPEAFVAEAERGGFVHELTAAIMERSLTDFRSILKWNPDFRININLTISDLLHDGFFALLESMIRKFDLPPMSIAFEITEGVAARGSELIPIIKKLRQIGFSVQIDDFGTGYSSLSRLHDLDVDCLKIDRSLTQAAGMDGVVSILPQIISIATALHLDIIFEGIETESQARSLAESGPHLYGQGWNFGRPMPAKDLIVMLKSQEGAVDIERRSQVISADELPCPEPEYAEAVQGD